MKFFLPLTMALLLCINQSGAQVVIECKDAATHIGDSVALCGKIYGGIFLPKAKNQPTFLNMGAAYPNQQLTIVIWGDKRKQFGFKPEEKFKNKDVCVCGRIEVFNGKPQIVISSATQLQEKL